MMPHTITHEESSSRNEYGKPNHGSAASYSARVVYKNDLVRADDGAEKVSKGYVWIQGTPSVTPQDRITLPDGTTPTILSVEEFPDEDGSHHVKVYFQ